MSACCYYGTQDTLVRFSGQALLTIFYIEISILVFSYTVILLICR